MHIRLSLLFVPAVLLFGCSKTEDTDVLCPSGTIRQGSVCVPPGDPDAGEMGADTGLPPKDGGEDAGADTGTDGGTDSGPIDAGEDAATISTAALDFGGTIIGTTESLTFTIENRTAMPVAVNVGPLTGAPDFTLTSSAARVTLEANQSISVEVAYAPAAAGAHAATLPVQLCEDGCTIDVQISGTGLVEAIACTPAPLDFGLVNPGACATRDVECANLSLRGATIFDATLTSNSSPAFEVTGSATTPVTLAGGDVLTLSVDYCPEDYDSDSGAIALTIDHPDPRYTTKTIALSGAGGGPDIQCTAAVDFGVAGVGQSVQRNASCTNGGNVPLLVTSAAFLSGTSAELSAVLSVNGAPVTFPLAIPAGDALDIEMTFAPNAPATHSATFRIAGNDTDTPQADIAVTAEALTANGCTVAISPAAIAFGAVTTGAATEASAIVSNTGSGACAVNVLGLSAATGPQFTLVDGAQSVSLAPNDSLAVRVRFSPDSESQFTGAVELSTTDLANPTPSVALAGDGLSPFGSIRAIPAAIDFGGVQAGCTNLVSQQLSLQNTAAAPASVDVTLEAGSPAEIGLIAAVPNPVSIPAGGTVDFTVTFQPAAAGTFIGRVQIAIAGGATIYVPVEGDAGPTAQTTVTFPAQPAPQLDVLVVVDDSGSMSEEQTRLSAAAQILIDRGDAAGAEYQFGVVTTDGSPGVSGTLRGTPAVVPWTSPTRSGDLAVNINQGVAGSGVEEGLRTMTEAVTDSALLAGPNAGFLRPNAQLAIIVISDEEDQSPGTVASYLDTLTTDRPAGAPGTPRIYTITGGLTGCATGDPTTRFVEAAMLSGGFDRSICLPDYSAIITEIADDVFAPRRARFPLGAPPVPGSVAVRVNGSPAPAADWGFDYVTSEVVFVRGGEPLLSESVEIDYTALCVPATCGDATPNAGEQCDDGNAVNTDACLDSCLDAFCGDSFTFAAEQCDDGNTVAGDGCNGQCTIEGCGNGILEPPEECDDGATNSDSAPNACRTACLNAFCGDAVTDTGEQCDDGNNAVTDACIACGDAFCGDGFVQQGVEECDDGNTVDTDDCANDCVSNLINFVVTDVQQPLTPAAGTALTIGDEDIVPVAIGFPFIYLDTPVADVQVGDNGFLMFEPAPGFGAFYTNVAIPRTAAPNSIVAWWWDDHDPGRLLPAAPEVRTAMTGTAPNRVRTITFLNIPVYDPGNTETGHVTAEVRLYETTNVVEVHYGQIVDAANDTEWSASAGWESAGGTRGAAVLACTPACLQEDWPADTIYRYTPQ